MNSTGDWKMKNARKTSLSLVLGMVFATGCTSIQDNSALEGLTGSDDVTTNPYVSAYIEYPGPQKKWAGPSSLSMKIDAKGEGYSKVEVYPEYFQSLMKTTAEATAAARGPASEANREKASAALTKQQVQTESAMTTEAARAQFAFLAEAMKTQHAAFEGCMYPVRARLIRANGEVLEKYGCRGQNGWPRVASEIVSESLIRNSRDS